MGDRTDASRNVSLEPPGAADGETRHNSVASPSEASLSSGKADVATRRARRTTVYPNVNSTNKIEKPFSRSAAKRGSVMALGSIEHLQHYFTKAGLSASKLPKGAKGPFVPALGPGVSGLAAPSDVPTLVFDLPPSPMPPPPPSPGVSSVPVAPSPYTADPEALKFGVIKDLEAAENAWHLDASPHTRSRLSLSPDDLSPSPPSDAARDHRFDVLHVLKVTTGAIRSVRNYLLALPDDHPTLHFGANLIEAFRYHSLSRRGITSRRLVSGSSTPRPPAATPSAVSSSPSFGLGALLPAPPDPPSIIRRAALDVLSVLRVLEERSRLPLSDEAYEASHSRLRAESPVNFALDRDTGTGGSVISADEGSDTAGPVTLVSGSPPHPPKPEIIPLKVQGREKAVPVWADPDEDQWQDFDEDTVEKQDPWDERLVLGGGWLYRRDVDVASIEKERSVVRRYLDLVDEVLFTNSIPATPGQRGWQRAKLESAAKTRAGTFPRPSLLASDGSPAKNGESNLARKRLISTTLLDAMSEISMLTTEPDSISIDTRVPDDGQGHHQNDNSIPDDSLPSWARRSSYASDPVGRLYSFIAAHLPPELLSFLPTAPPSPQDPFISSPTPTSGTDEFRERLLAVLSDGQILCTAYNLAVRRSRNPWGYIHLENVHDLLDVSKEPENEQLELDMSLGSSQRTNAKAKSGWTFRRTENLRYWAAALKHRYTIPIVTLSHAEGTKRVTEQKSTTSLSRGFSDPLVSPPVYFEPKLVAAREDGWENMLESVLDRWLEAVLNETRTH